jgi:hypothetical protein
MFFSKVSKVSVCDNLLVETCDMRCFLIALKIYLSYNYNDVDCGLLSLKAVRP